MDNKKVFNRKFLFISLGLVVAIVAGLIVLGYLSVLWKQPQQKVVLVSTVCGSDIVTKYNNVSQVKQSGREFVTDDAGIKNLAAEIQDKKNYQNDPTCQMIVLSAAVHAQDYKSAKEAYNAVKLLHDKHDYPDNNLNLGGSLSAYEGFVQDLSPSNKGADNQEPQGGA